MSNAILDEDACLRLIAEDGDTGWSDAEALLLSRIPNARRRFMALDRAMRALLSDVQQVFPDAQYYTASGGFNLMLGSSHGGSQNPQQQLVALSGKVRISDGDF